MSVFFYGCITLDGFLADKNHNLDWLYQTGDAEETEYESFYNRMDVTIMGKRTFNEIEKLDNIDSIYPTTENYVITHAESLSSREFIPVSCDVVEFVKQIETDKNIWIVGGNTIVAPLLDNDMIDNMIIQIAPCYWEKESVVYPERRIKAVSFERSETIRAVCRIELC